MLVLQVQRGQVEVVDHAAGLFGHRAGQRPRPVFHVEQRGFLQLLVRRLAAGPIAGEDGQRTDDQGDAQPACQARIRSCLGVVLHARALGSAIPAQE